MIKDIVRDTFFLSRRSVDAVPGDLHVIRDLCDTYEAHRAVCAGMAANMIGYNKRIIVIGVGPGTLVMCNPVITAKKDRYETEEGCLSLRGLRKAVRYREITVTYQDTSFQKHTGTYSGYTAQIIQHEIDHCSGILI